MNKKFYLIHTKEIFKKYPIYIVVLGLIGLVMFGLGIFLFGSNINQFYVLIIAFSLISISIIKSTIYFYKKMQFVNLTRIQDYELLRERKRAEILLEVGGLCSWQYSTKAGILKFDSSRFKLLGATRNYYTYEELIRNRYLKRILDFVEDSGLTVFDEEAYFPIIKKWVIIRGRCVDTAEDGKPNQFIGIVIDNTERMETLKKIENISVTDELTGLKNRRFFFETFNRELNLYKRSKKEFSVAMIDLDYFKKINDTFGHLAGDFILKEFSNVLSNEVRPYDIVSRFGGEEFIVLFPEINKHEAESIINRVKERVENCNYKFNDKIIPFTFSCGVGDITEIGLYTEKEFITIIDTRLYKAKHLGRNLVVSGG